MIAGHNSTEYFKDLQFNMSDEDYYRIAASKKNIQNKVKELEQAYNKDRNNGELANSFARARNTLSYLDEAILPGVYNQLKGYDIQSAAYTGLDESSIDVDSRRHGKVLANVCDEISSLAKYEEGDAIEKLTKALYKNFKQYETDTPTEEEVEKEKQQQKSYGPGNSKDGEKPEDGQDNPMKNMTGYKKLVEWLNTIKRSTAADKKFKEITKMSDLQKVSAVEFVKPRGLFMKKLVGRQLYCKQTQEAQRFMHTIIDCSPSMSSYQTWRNIMIAQMYDDCQKLKINFENTFWDTRLYDKSMEHYHQNLEKFCKQSIESKDALYKKVLSIRPSGCGTDMEKSTIDKLNEIKRTNTRQYLLVVSDGDGQIADQTVSKEIYRICSEKNVEIKFALFHAGNTMKGIKKTDIFYIYEGSEEPEETIPTYDGGGIDKEIERIIANASNNAISGMSINNSYQWKNPGF